MSRESLARKLAERAARPASPFAIDAPADAWPSLAKEALHGVAGEYVDRLAPHTEADSVAVLVTFVVAFGNVGGRNSFVRVENDRHHANLFACIVGATSNGRKGTSAGQALRLFEAVDHEWRVGRIVSGLSSGEGLIHHLQGDDAESANADRRAFVLESEFASVLRVAEREGNTITAQLRSAWDGSTLRVLTRRQPLRVDDAHVSIVGHITRDELRRYLQRTEIANGLANRFLWVAARRSKMLPEGGAAHLIDWSILARDLRAAVEFARSAGEVRKSSGAVELWASVYGDLTADTPGLLGAVIGRGAAQVLRLSLCYALLDRSNTIRPEHLAAALALWEYADESARWIFGDATGDRDADRILEAARTAAPEGVTMTYISSELFGRNRPASRIAEAVRLLEAAGLVAADRRLGTGGRAETTIRALCSTNKRRKRTIPPEVAS